MNRLAFGCGFVTVVVATGLGRRLLRGRWRLALLRMMRGG